MLLRTTLLSVAMVAGFATISADVAFARRGADDPAGHVRQGRGADDPANHDAADDRGGAGGGAGTSGRNGADDPANHDANDDRVTAAAATRAADTSGRNGADDPPEVENERPGDRQRGRGKGN